MLSTNHIAAFLSFNISKTIGVDFLHAVTYLLKLQIDDIILGGRGQACPQRLFKLSGGPFICDLLLNNLYACTFKIGLLTVGIQVSSFQ